MKKLEHFEDEFGQLLHSLLVATATDYADSIGQKGLSSDIAVRNFMALEVTTVVALTLKKMNEEGVNPFSDAPSSDKVQEDTTQERTLEVIFPTPDTDPNPAKRIEIGIKSYLAAWMQHLKPEFQTEDNENKLLSTYKWLQKECKALYSEQTEGDKDLKDLEDALEAETVTLEQPEFKAVQFNTEKVNDLTGEQQNNEATLEVARKSLAHGMVMKVFEGILTSGDKSWKCNEASLHEKKSIPVVLHGTDQIIGEAKNILATDHEISAEIHIKDEFLKDLDPYVAMAGFEMIKGTFKKSRPRITNIHMNNVGKAWNSQKGV